MRGGESEIRSTKSETIPNAENIIKRADQNNVQMQGT